jgi:hypothetical protein
VFFFPGSTRFSEKIVGLERGQISIVSTTEELISRKSSGFSEKIVGLERGPLSLVSTTEELISRKSSGSGLEIREYDRRDPSQKVGITSPISDGRSVSTVRSRTQDKEFFVK